jgi:D-alanyl-D-alanine dipeptidase
LPEGFGYVHEAVPGVVYDIRYHGTDNFLGQPVDGYLEPVAILTEEALDALSEVAGELAGQGYGLIVFDGFRPQKAVDHFVRWAGDLGDTLTKQKYYPEVDKSVLFEQGYISARSSHSRGSTVDLTLFELSTGDELDMGTGFDYFGPLSGHGTEGITPQQAANRLLLRKVMERHGFVAYEAEWWHYTLASEPHFDTYFNFDIR